MAKHDFIVIGGGHNGLIAAGYLGKAGFDVCVVEANDEFGGGTRSGEVCAPGYISDLGGMIHGMISRTPLIMNDELDLQGKYGLKYIRPDALCCTIFDDGTNLVLNHSIDQTVKNIAKFSQKDAEMYPRFIEYMGNMIKVAGIGANTPPPKWGVMQSALDSSPEGRDFLVTINSSAQDIVEQWFESPQLRITLTRWCTEMMINPTAVGTATLLYFVLYIHQLVPPFPEGGSLRMVEALKACCSDYGVTLKTNASVVKVKVDAGTAKGVVLESGEEIAASKAVICTANVKDLVLKWLGDEAPANLVRQARNLKSAEFVPFNMSVALKKVPDFKTGNELKAAYCIECAPLEEEYLRTFNEYRFGKFEPNMPLITMPCLWDSTRCPEGHSVVNIYNYAPANLYGDYNNWNIYKEEMADKAWAFTKDLFTNITDDDLIGDRWVFTPVDYEKWNPAFHKGDITHIGLQPSQMYGFRPFPNSHNYKVALDNLYVLGSCSHPGGGIAGAARAGVQAVLDDFDVNFNKLVKK